MKNPVCVHFHIFKNAGTTLEWILKNNFSKNAISIDSDNPKDMLHFDMIAEILSTQAKYSAMSLGMKLEGMYKGRKVCVLNSKGPYIYMIPNKDLPKEKFIVLSMSDFKKPTDNTKLRGNKLIYEFPSYKQRVWNKTRDEWMIIFDELAQASNLVEQEG